MTDDQMALPPPDLVRPQGPTTEVADLLKAHAGRPITVHWPGEVIEGPDGVPVAVTPPQTFIATLARPHLDGTDTTNEEN